MNTITATDLRTNLDSVMKRVSGGQELTLTHRFYGAIKLSPMLTITKRAKLAGLAAFDAAPKRPSTLSKSKTIKDLYRESISKKYL